MMDKMKIIVIFILFQKFVTCKNYLSNPKPPGLYVWPQPKSIEVQPQYLRLSKSSFEILGRNQTQCPLLYSTIRKYKNLIFIEDCSLKNPLATTKQFDETTTFDDNLKGELISITVWVNQTVPGCETLPSLNMDEGYDIDISLTTSLITAKSIWGAIRGLETFSQIVRNVGLNQFVVNFTRITDAPRFPHRGIMLDTGRHFLPVSVLKQNLDAMAYNKMNVFHWHISDDQSFPYVSQLYPNMSLMGAYVPKTHIYTAANISDVIEYARVRGIRVVIEFDTPDHTKSWIGQSGLLSQCYINGEPVASGDGQFGPINPIRNTTYTFIKNFFTEVINLFPDTYLHMGGDEVDYSCAATNPEFVNYMAANNIQDMSQLAQVYVSQLLDFINSKNRKSIVWEEVFYNGIGTQIPIVHVWRVATWKNRMNVITNFGYSVILSAVWYLNGISYGTDWFQYYDVDPYDFNGTAAQNAMVLGGEACLWGEYLDSSNLISTTWPRAIAVAERLWSPQTVVNSALAIDRFNVQFCLMQKRGIAVGPINGHYEFGLSPGFCQCDYA